MLKLEPSIDHFSFNNTEWTIPVYEVNSETPVYNIKLRTLDDKEKIYRLSNRENYGFGSGSFAAELYSQNLSPVEALRAMIF